MERHTASSVSSCASGMAEAWAVPLVPLAFVLDIGSTAAAARANGVGISAIDIVLGLLLFSILRIDAQQEQSTEVTVGKQKRGQGQC